MSSYANVEAMLASLNPVEPVYCIHPNRCRKAAKEFLEGFPGRVLYAVKANNHPAVIRHLYEAGVRHFDCASLPEIELINSICAHNTCYFMNPVRIKGAAADAFRRFGVRHFMIDHINALAALNEEITAAECVTFARMAVHHASAAEDLSSKFGAAPSDIPAILGLIRDSGAEPALAFNVGSNVRSPDAYRHSMAVAADVLSRLPFRIRLLDIGGGYPKTYPGFEVPPMPEYFAAIQESAKSLPLANNAELLAEPGRALVASSLSAVVQVLLRKEDRVYINDGMYGSFWELRCNGANQFPVRTFRGSTELSDNLSEILVFGPTCDADDQLPEKIRLPEDIDAGDYLEFDSIGAYSLSGRTDFNGFFSDHLVTIG